MNIPRNIMIGLFTTTSVLTTILTYSGTMRIRQYPSQIEMKEANPYIDNYIKESSNVYKSAYNSKEELLNIFGTITDFTDEEQLIYNRILKEDAIKTGVKLF